jgi:hypothetical protein
LDPFAALRDVHEAGFAHAANRLDTAGDLYARLIRQIIGGNVSIQVQNLLYRMSEIEPVAIATEPQRFDLRDTLAPLAK